MTDMETGYKLFKKYIDPDKLEQNTFGIEPEITIKLAKKKIKFFDSDYILIMEEVMMRVKK